MEVVNDVFVIGLKYLPSSSALQDLLKENIESFNKEIDKVDRTAYDTLFMLSTCNRFEIIGKGHLDMVLDHFTKNISFFQDLHDILYVKKAQEAIKHIFHMSSGLDSNILGDMEILGQFKTSCVLANKAGRICNFMERLINISLQSSKEIRRKTNITNGTTSLSYAAIQILKETKIPVSASILLIGLGKFGKSIARNLRQYFPENSLTLANRTLEKSKLLSEELNCEYINYKHLDNELERHDVIISAITHQGEKNKTLYSTTKPCILIDLSVPSFFDTEITVNKSIKFIDINEASNIVNQSLTKRESSLPKAYAIIDKYLSEFLEWVEINERYLKTWKEKVKVVSEDCREFERLNRQEVERILNKSVGDYVVNVKKNKQNLGSQQLLLEYLDNNYKNNCLLLKYSNLKLDHNCNKCQNRFE